MELIPLYGRVGAINAPQCGQFSQSLAREISHCVTRTENVLKNFSFAELLLHCFTILSSLYNCWESNVLGLLLVLSVISRSYRASIGCFRCIELVRLLVTTGTCGAID